MSLRFPAPVPCVFPLPFLLQSRYTAISDLGKVYYQQIPLLSLPDTSVYTVVLAARWSLGRVSAGTLSFKCSQINSLTVVAKGNPFRSAIFCTSPAVLSGRRNMVDFTMIVVTPSIFKYLKVIYLNY